MALDDPYGPGVWGPYLAAQEQQPLMAGKVAASALENQAQGVKNQNAVLTQPSTVAEAAANASKAQSTATVAANEAQASTTLTPLEIAAKQQELANQRAASGQLADRLNGQAISQALAGLDPSSPTFSQDWDAKVQKLVDQGVPGAEQYLHKGSVRALDTVEALYGSGLTTTPGAAYGAAKTAAGGSAIEGGKEANPQVEELHQQFAAMSPDQWQQASTRINQLKAAIQDVDSSDNPGAALNRHAAEFGMPGLGDHFNPAMWEQLKSRLAPQLAAFDETVANRAAGTNVIKPTQIEKVGDNVVSLTRQPDGSITASTVAEANRWVAQPGAIGPHGGQMIFDRDDPQKNFELPGTVGRTTAEARLAIATKMGLTGQALADAVSGQSAIADRQFATAAAANVTAEIKARIGSDPTFKEPSPAERATMIAQEAADMRSAWNGGGGAPATPAPTGGAAAPPPTTIPGQRDKSGWLVPGPTAPNMLKAQIAGAKDPARQAQLRQNYDALYGPGAAARDAPAAR